MCNEHDYTHTHREAHARTQIHTGVFTLHSSMLPEDTHPSRFQKSPLPAVSIDQGHSPLL